MAVTSPERRDVNGELPAAPQTSLPTGCRALLWALLQDVFLVRDTLNRISPGDARYHVLTGVSASDREWLAADSDEPFSFLWTCHHLGIDPDAVRHCYGRAPSASSDILSGWNGAIGSSLHLCGSFAF